MKYILNVLLVIGWFPTSNGATKYNTEIQKEVVHIEHKISSPYLNYADSVINSKPTNLKSVAWRQKNPGNLRSFRTGKYRTFNTLDEGYKALIRQLKLYTSGKSMWTDSTTTLEEYINIYASEARTKTYYINVMTQGLKCLKTDKIAGLDVDSLAKYHIQMEDVKLFKIMYETK